MKYGKLRLLAAVFALAVAASLFGGTAAFAAETPPDYPQAVSVTYYNDVYTTRGFAWCTSAGVTDSALQYVEAEGVDSAADVDWSGEDVVTVNGTYTLSGEYASHKAHATGLRPGVKYYYRVGSPAADSFSAPAVFATDTGDNGAISFLHLTDAQEVTRNNYRLWGRVLDEAYETVPDAKFVAFTGDLTNDNHARLNMNQWIWALDEAPALRNSVIMPAAGNHDALNTAFADRFDIDYPGAVQRGAYYSFDYGDMHFVTLNTNDSGMEDQIAWLERDLAAADSKWKVVQMHKGLISTGDHTNDGDVVRLRELLLPIMAKYRVDLVLQGHDHVYTRSVPYFNGTDETGGQYSGRLPNREVATVTEVSQAGKTVYDVEPDGTYYVTINYSSTKQYPPAGYDRNLIYPAVYNGTEMSIQPGFPMFGAVRIEGDRLTYDAYTVNLDTGKVALFDHFGVIKNTHAAVDDLIAALPNEVTARSARELAAAKAAYDGLTARARQRVSEENAAKLTAALEKFSLTDALAACGVIERIDAIGAVDLTEACQARVREAETAYYTLNEPQRRLVVNAADIERAKAEIIDLRFAGGVERLIAGMEGDAELIRAARMAYDNLTDAQKRLVSNYALLSAAEERRESETNAGCGCAFVSPGSGGSGALLALLGCALAVSTGMNLSVRRKKRAL